jgi:Glycosyltransferase WbsX
VHGFAVYHYWFNGEKALHQPYERMLLDGEPDLPFMFIWANETWSRCWDGSEREVIQPQTYGGRDEWAAHAEYLRPFLEHPNYIRLGGRRVLGLYRPGHIPQLTERLRFYRQTLGEDLHFTTLSGTFKDEQSPTLSTELDSAIEFAPFFEWFQKSRIRLLPHQQLFPGVSPGFDSSPRRGPRAIVATVPPFAEQLRRCRSAEAIFVNSWNEWGEQSLIEPSDRDGDARLREIATFTGRANRRSVTARPASA